MPEQRRDASGGFMMKIRLPGVTKALKDKVPQELGCQSPDLSHLPPTPETDKELICEIYKITKPF